MKKFLSLFVVAGALMASVGCDESKPSSAAPKPADSSKDKDKDAK